ncbi:MAG: hypothetical protein LBM93_15610 [Oscillospiraceae bacterium]|jgi:hypothetical protein|nr:hypothetical protein [Oscillospiraceae bacterium]
MLKKMLAVFMCVVCIMGMAVPTAANTEGESSVLSIDAISGVEIELYENNGMVYFSVSVTDYNIRGASATIEFFYNNMNCAVYQRSFTSSSPTFSGSHTYHGYGLYSVEVYGSVTYMNNTTQNFNKSEDLFL